MTKEIKQNFSDAAQEPFPPLTIDWDLYGEMLKDSDLSEAEQRELIETLWTIVVGFVDLGFGIHPVQQASQESSGQHIEISKLIEQVVLSSQSELPNNSKQQTLARPICRFGTTEES